jgi:hypothetical protein
MNILGINFEGLNQLLLLCCFIPAVVLLIGGFFLIRNFTRFLRALTPDEQALHRQYEALKASHPNDTPKQLVRRIVNQYAMNQGIVGAITSVGGILTLPLGLTVDLLHAGRSNTALSHFIAQIYGIEEGKALNAGQLLVLGERKVPPQQLAVWQERFSGLAYQQLAKMILKKSIAKVVPFAGAIVGFVVNWSSAQFFGRAADQYYSGNLDTLIDEGTKRLRR